MSNLRPLPEDLQKVAIDELNEVPERIAADIEALKTWIKQQPHLRARTDDQFLLAFLRGCKFRMEKVKSKIDKYYTLRTKYPNFYTLQTLSEERIVELIRMGVGIQLPTPLNENGPRIMLIRIGSYPPEAFEDIMCIANGLQELTMMEDDYANVNGFIDVLDLSTCTAAHMLHMTPTVMKKMSVFAEDAVPLRQRASHFIHVNSAFETVFNLLKPIMPAQQQERLHLHGKNLYAFYERIPQKYLPVEYGGENGSIEQIIEGQVKQYLEYRQYFEDDKKFGTDEKLRIGKSVDYDNIFGVEGSFRKLNVD